jgi:hypothetical protein
MHRTSICFLGSFTVALVCLVSWLLIGCGSNTSTSTSPAADAGAGLVEDVSVPTAPGCTNIVPEESCDTTRRPIVFVHGTYGSGDNFENVASLLTSNGYCADHIVAVDYNSLGDQPGADCTGPNTPQGCGKIDAVVNAVLAKFTDDAGVPLFTQVDLAGHSQGTEHCGVYLGTGGVGAHADKVAHYLNFSGIPNVGSVPTLSLSSQHDLDLCPHHATGTSICAFAETADGGTTPIAPVTQLSGTGTVGCSVAADGGTAGGETGDAGADDGGSPCTLTQYTFVNQDHFAVAASKGTFIQVYKFLNNGQEPQYTDVQCGDDPVTIEGLGESFADNIPVVGKIEVRKVTTPRALGPPDQTIMPDTASQTALTPAGHFTATISRNAYYEFAGYDADGNLLGYQYFTPFKRTNRLVRLLAPASATDGGILGAGITAMTTGAATKTSKASTVIARWYGGAFRTDLGASLQVNGSETLSAQAAGAPTTSGNLIGGTVGLFLENHSGTTMSNLGLVTSAPFIAFTDVYIQATTPAFIPMTFTAGSEDLDRVSVPVVLSNWPSSQVLLSVIFQ